MRVNGEMMRVQALNDLSSCNSVDYSLLKSLYLPRHFCTQFPTARRHSTVENSPCTVFLRTRIFMLQSRSQSAENQTQDGEGIGSKVKLERSQLQQGLSLGDSGGIPANNMPEGTILCRCVYKALYTAAKSSACVHLVIFQFRLTPTPTR